MSGGAARWMPAVLSAAALAALTPALALAQAAPEPPLPDPGEAVAGMLVGLENARLAAAPDPPRVAALLREALAALDKVEAAGRTPLERVEAAIASQPRKTPTRPQAAERLRLRTHQAHAALARGDVYRLAAAALPPGHPDRAADMEQAVQIFGALRVEYRDLLAAFLGYVGEARAQRAAGNLDAAYAVLKPALAMAADPKEPATQEIRRAAFVELLEIHLAADPKKALAEAASLAQGPAFKDAPTWLARIDYVAARAEAEELRRAAAPGQPAPEAAARAARAAALLRRDAVAAAAPPFDRLALLADLDRLAGGSLLARDELLRWADLLAAAGRPGALDAYRRARAAGPLSDQQSLVYISLLVKDGALAEAAGAADELLPRLEPGHAHRPAVIQVRAAALLKMLEAAGAAAPESLRARAADALRAAVDGGPDAAVRRDALRQFVALQAARGGPAACAGVLAAHPDLVAGDPYLGYSQAAAKWQKLSAEAAADDAVAAAQARAVVEEAAAAEQAAAQAGQPALAARAALVRAQILASPLGRDPRAALMILSGRWDSLRADPSTAEAAGWLRVELMMDLGLVDAASKALADLPDGASPNSPAALLRLAEALADRSAGLPPQALADVQREVLRFADRAMSMAVADPQAFRSASERAARALLAAGAWADAQRILTSLLASLEVQKDPRALLENSLALAEALRRGGKAEEALKHLDALAPSHPGDAAAHLERSLCLAAIGRHEEAVASARQARMLSPAGGQAWCRATLAVAEGLAAQGMTDAAADILRVCDALYPAFGSAELRGRLKRLRQDLDSPAAGPGRKPAGARENES